MEYARANIEEARRVGQGKPILPLLWMRYHTGGDPELASIPIPRDYWRLQLKTLVGAGVDGIVIWRGMAKRMGLTCRVVARNPKLPKTRMRICPEGTYKLGTRHARSLSK